MTSGFATMNYTKDTTPPELLEYTLNLEQDHLTLTFDEPVRTSTFNFTAITLISNCSGGSNFTLTGGSFVPPGLQDGQVEVTIALLMSDIISIKSDTDLAVDSLSTFLQLTNVAVEDMAFQNLLEIDCLSTEIHQLDTVRVQLTSFDINMHTGVLDLTFNDVVDVTTWNQAAVTFQSDRTAGDGPTYDVTAANILTTNNNFTIQVQLSDADLFGLKSQFGLATDINNTFITTRASIIDDTAERDIIAITDGKALQVSNYFADTVSPELTMFSIDMDAGIMNLTFNDFPNSSTLMYDQIVLHTAMSASTFDLTLAPATVQVSTDGFTLSISFTEADLNMLKLRTEIATSTANSFVSFTSNTVTDFAGNDVIAVAPSSARQANSFIPDTTAPELVRYSLDMDDGFLSSLSLRQLTPQPLPCLTLHCWIPKVWLMPLVATS